ncbi:MAG: hypothetical protein AAF721_40080 [Myxococcota bacterium]
MRRLVADGPGIIPEQDPSLPSLRDRLELPTWALVGAATLVVASIVGQQSQGAEAWDWRWGFAGAVVLLGGVLRARTRRSDEPGPTVWAYGPFGRLLVGAGIVWQLAAVSTWLLPDKDCVSTFRPAARKGFSVWLRNTTTDQGWGMFAPNPPRSNVFMKVLVTDDSGEVWDLRTDVYAPEQKPMPWIWNTRRRKMNRRIIGGESGPSDWYRKWYARYECRRWAREHGGQTPKSVELVKLWYKIPTPEQTRQRGYYVAEDLLRTQGHEKVMHTERCPTTVVGQLPNFIRRRDGLPLLDEDEYRPWHKHKRKAWDKRKQREAARAE